eukprot:scaffold1558_cov403-Prasinococcus_capsulatus_cf.AAC.34
MVLACNGAGSLVASQESALPLSMRPGATLAAQASLAPFTLPKDENSEVSMLISCLRTLAQRSTSPDHVADLITQGSAMKRNADLRNMLDDVLGGM